MYMYICTCTHEGGEGVSSGRKQFKIYGPTHFAATWKKYLEICERDGTNASKEIRQYVRDQVARREPGNPQRPLTAFVEGHEDEVQASWSKTVQELLARAERLGGELRYGDIVAAIRAQGVTGPMIVTRSGSMCDALRAVGVGVVY